LIASGGARAFAVEVGGKVVVFCRFLDDSKAFPHKRVVFFGFILYIFVVVY
jgi:hypothetical protein